MNLEKFWQQPTKSEIDKNIQKEIMEQESRDERKEAKNEFSLRKTADVLSDIDSEEIYSWYADAITRRDREPLEIESFHRHFFENGSMDETFAFGDKEKGFLLGYNKYDIFIPTHFAPKTLRGGYELFQSLGTSKNIASVIAITEDLSETLKKMPAWNHLELNEEILSNFRGELLKKEIYYNSQEDTEKLLFSLMIEFMNQNTINQNSEMV